MRYLVSLGLMVMLSLWLPAGLGAEVIGRLTQVEGQVDLLKQGKLPAVPLKVQDGVEPGDIIRTKSQSRAQVAFVDDTTLTIAPGSRVAVEAYMYDPDKGQRQGVLQVFYGMVQTVVTRLVQAEKPEFLLKTHTAVMGVRGTKWYTLLRPNATDIYNESGRLCVRNIFPEIVGEQCLNDLEALSVLANTGPGYPSPFPQQDLLLLQRQLLLGAAHQAGGSEKDPAFFKGTPTFGLTGPLNQDTGVILDKIIIIPPKVQPAPPPGPPPPGPPPPGPPPR